MCTSEGRRHRAIREPATVKLIGWPEPANAEWLIVELAPARSYDAPGRFVWPADLPLHRGLRVLAELAVRKGERS